jgi:transcriptional regulator with XRE-family HTH domain
VDEDQIERLSDRQREALQPEKDEAQRRSIGRRLAEARKAQGLSQGALGERLGVTQQAVAQYESGKRLPGVLAFVRLAEVLGVPCQELVREQYPGAPLDPEARREWMKARSDAFASRRSKPEAE